MKLFNLHSLRHLLVLTAMLATVVANAYTISGYVTDDEGIPEGYATFRIFSENNMTKPAAMGITQDDGLFSMTLPATGKYILNISSVGKKSLTLPFEITAETVDTNLGTLTMLTNDAELGEVEIIATRPLVSKEIDRIGYDVQADNDSKTSTVQDILRKVPMVTVENDGTIKVKGGSNFKIYKDGHPSNSFTSNAKDIFAAIPASMIEKIEVITDPGAREDAEGVGAILNIVTVKQSSINGIMGNLRAGMMTHNSTPVGGLWLTGNIGKVVMSANAGYFHQSDGMSRYQSDMDATYLQSGNRQTNRSTAHGNGDFIFYGIDGSYELDSLNLFTLEFGGHYSDYESFSNSTSNFYDPTGFNYSTFDAITHTPKSRGLAFNGNFNYQHSTKRAGETVTLSYQISNSASDNESATVYDYTGQTLSPMKSADAYSHSRFLENTLQVDWTRPFNIHNTISVGGKFISRSNSSRDSTLYVGLPDAYTDFSHLTTIGAAYADYRYTLNRLSARAGLRYEYSRLSAKYRDGSNDPFGSSLNDWVPNASIMYSLNDRSSIKASYTTRINRPGIDYLNPAVVLTPTSQQSGNPNLSSVHYNSISLNYSLFSRNFNLDFNASYDFTNHAIVDVETIDALTDFKTETYSNAGRERNVNFSIFAQWSVTSTTSLMTNTQVSWKHIKHPQSGLSNQRWAANVYFRFSQQLPLKLRFDGVLFYGTGDLDNVYSYTSMGARGIFHGLSLQRSFLKNDALTVKLDARNPFNSKFVNTSHQNRGDINSHTTSQMPNMRIFGISLSYKFGQVKASVKKTNTSITNDDLQGGSSTPSQSVGGMSM